MKKRDFYIDKTDIVWVIIAKSDEIRKITHLVFSREIMGADILEKLCLTAEKSLFAWGTLFNEQNEQLLRIFHSL